MDKITKAWLEEQAAAHPTIKTFLDALAKASTIFEAEDAEGEEAEEAKEAGEEAEGSDDDEGKEQEQDMQAPSATRPGADSTAHLLPLTKDMYHLPYYHSNQVFAHPLSGLS